MPFFVFPFAVVAVDDCELIEWDVGCYELLGGDGVVCRVVSGDFDMIG